MCAAEAEAAALENHRDRKALSSLEAGIEVGQAAGDTSR